MVVYLCHIESVIRSPILPARESGHSSSAPRKKSGRSRRVFGSWAWHVCAPSGALRASSSKAVRHSSGSGSQRSLHRQTAQELDPSSAASCSHPGALDQRLGCRGFGGTPPGQSQPWVGRGLSASWQWNYNISRIVSPPKRWREPTICLSQCPLHRHR